MVLFQSDERERFSKVVHRMRRLIANPPIAAFKKCQMRRDAFIVSGATGGLRGLMTT
jgi:hypothetical protein